MVVMARTLPFQLADETHLVHAETTVLIRSPERVGRLGEVFTPGWLVSDMLDLARDADTRTDVVAELESRCLDPACGNGQFLTESLRRKLAALIVAQGNGPKPYHPAAAFQYSALAALGAVYGVDIDRTNVSEARWRLSDIMAKGHWMALRRKPPIAFMAATHAILGSNVICADFLGSGGYSFTEYVQKGRGRFERRRWLAAHLRASLSDLWSSALTPEEVFPAVHWRELGAVR